ncbi:hypothetical protein FQR65_LT10848 [Abscondita terminalis]|nr:hypothetical protein FQR65_LT10848 [Abscondita terminalis]
MIPLLYCLRAEAGSIKKTIDDSPSENKITTDTLKVDKKPLPAIVAIEIVDEPDKNSTGKNSKRTIESSLGYGYHDSPNSYDNNHGKKFVIYKYSQHDIPASPDYSSINSYSKPYSSHTDVQKSIGYNLGTVTSHINRKQPTSTPLYTRTTASTPQYYNSDNTFYTTYDQQGLGGISNQIPQQAQTHSGTVPVIFLKVYTNQLTSPNTPLYTNLPQSHPYSNLNNINLQAYLQNYLQQYLQSQQVVYQPTYQQEYVQHYQQPQEYQTNSPTYENYPSPQHTRVVFHSNNGHIPSTKPQTGGLSAYKSVSYPTYVPPQHDQLNEIQQASLQYSYTTDDKNDNQAYMYVYPNNGYQAVYYQDNNDQYYQTNQNYEDDTNSEIQVTTSQPYNYHAHPKKEPVKEKRKTINVEINTPSRKQGESRAKSVL